MDRIEGMTVLLAIIDAGSLSAAARRMNLPLQTVSRKLADLERRLGARLLTRTTRNLALTEAGTAYAAAARRIVEAVDEAEREAVGEFVTPKGELVITAPLFFGRRHVVPVVADFLAAFPEIDVRLVLGDRNANLLDDQIDMAIRIGRLPDSAMIATSVGELRAVTAASPTLLARHGIPQRPEALAALPCISPDGPISTVGWSFRDPDSGARFEVPVRPRLSTSSEAAAEAAIRDVGFVRALHYQVDDAVRAGALALVLERFEREPFPVHLVHAPRGQLPLKMRRFLDFAAPRLRRTLLAIGQ